MTTTPSTTSVLFSDQQALIEEQARTIKKLEELTKRLQADLSLLKDALYRSGRTQIGPEGTAGQLCLFGEEPKTESPAAVEPKSDSGKRKRASTGRRPLPASLERVEDEVEVDDRHFICDCGKPDCRRIIMGYEETETVAIIPQKIFVKVTKRPKLVCPDGMNGVLTPPPEPRVIDKCLADDSLLIHVARQKFIYHMPLHRIAKSIKEQGWRVAESTLCDWVHTLADRLAPIVVAMKHWLLQQPYLQADETPAKARDPNKKGKHKQIYFWVYSLPWQEVIFDYQTGRSGEHARNFLEDFQGDVLQVDEFSGYDAYFRQNPGVTRAGCWAHAIRMFKAAVKARDWLVEATEVRDAVSKLMKLETEMRKRGRSHEQRLRVRQRIHTPVLAWVKERLVEAIENPKTEYKGAFGKAVRYCNNHWEALTAFLSRGDVETDNNAIENSIRALAIGRKNWMHIGHIDAGDTAASFYTILGSCLRLGINTEEYLQDVFKRLPTLPPQRVHELTPRAWLEDRGESSAEPGVAT